MEIMRKMIAVIIITARCKSGAYNSALDAGTL
jgi:hypothetical protein